PSAHSRRRGHHQYRQRRKPFADRFVRSRSCARRRNVSGGTHGRNVQRHRQMRFESGRLAALRRRTRPPWKRNERLRTHNGYSSYSKRSGDSRFLRRPGKPPTPNGKTPIAACRTCGWHKLSACHRRIVVSVASTLLVRFLQSETALLMPSIYGLKPKFQALL